MPDIDESLDTQNSVISINDKLNGCSCFYYLFKRLGGGGGIEKKKKFKIK